MSLTPFKDTLPSIWRPTELGLFLSYQTRRIYHYLRDVAPVLVKYEVRQVGRSGVDSIPYISQDAKRDIKRWIGDYDPKHFVGTFTSMWSEFNTYENGEKGLRIHLNIRVQSLKDLKCVAVAYFYYKDGNTLRDFNGNYNTYDGQVSTSRDFTPAYHDAIYQNLELFIPYSELHVGGGRYDLMFIVKLYSYRCGTFFGSSPNQYFELTSN